MTTLLLEPNNVDQWFPANRVEREAVLAQLDVLVASPYFRTSKRYPSFLRFVVEQELAGNGGELKERTIGIEVFGRAITYDTNDDPIVRVTAASEFASVFPAFMRSRHLLEPTTDSPFQRILHPKFSKAFCIKSETRIYGWGRWCDCFD